MINELQCSMFWEIFLPREALFSHIHLRPWQNVLCIISEITLIRSWCLQIKILSLLCLLWIYWAEMNRPFLFRTKVSRIPSESASQISSHVLTLPVFFSSKILSFNRPIHYRVLLSESLVDKSLRNNRPHPENRKAYVMTYN